MIEILARHALLPSGWARDVLVKVADDGKIADVDTDCTTAGDHQVGILLPAPVNCHSHAFQRAMAGLTEKRGPDPTDSFWTWRQLMFRFLNQLTPDHVQTITEFVQMQMLEAGYATNVEFHYLHHQPDGTPYANLAEMAERVTAAAANTGAGLTLLPVLYQYGGCDKRPLQAGQVRFGNDPQQFFNLVEKSEALIGALPADCNLGVAPHSLRAVDPAHFPDLLRLSNGRPFHMHLAEQSAEVEEVRAAWGARPVEWVLQNTDVDETWCLIHCTQMQPHETIGLAQTGAVAGLCPLTESSLGDGIFDCVRWLDSGGRLAIGSDSNIRISQSEELRTLEYSQRLRDHCRAAIASRDKSTGRRLFDEMLIGGAQAAGRNSGKIESGQWADLMVLNDQTIDLLGKTGDQILDCFVFAGDDRMITDVWAAGRHVVQQGQHFDRQRIMENYRAVMEKLGDSI